MSKKKKIVIGVLATLGLLLLGGAGFVFAQTSSFDASMSKVYEVALPDLAAVDDPAVIERGEHLADSLGACRDCHGQDLGGQPMEDMGPIGSFHPPNITSGGIGKDYSDAEMARLLISGIKRDGTSVIFMPSGDFRWWPDEDVVALISWWRKQPAVDRPGGANEVGTLGKVLDRQDMLPIDIARRIDHDAPRETAPEPTPTAAYGAYIAKLCQGCHGPTLAGGPIPGAPPDMAVPSNLTPHATGLADWSKEEFFRVLDEGINKDGKKLDPMMPLGTLKAMNETEREALWAYLQKLPAKPRGER